MTRVDEAAALTHGLTRDEWRKVVDSLGRVPTWVELGIISVMWSEHCSYKSSRRHLKKLPTDAAWVLQGPGENAGVVDLGDGLAAAFKMESHNHPSFIEPFQGAATGVGGILRDVFTMGARPVANLNSLRFGRPEAPRMKFLMAGVVGGIGHYGNCVGVPTVGGEIAFDRSYDGNILVNAFTLGLLRSDRIFRSAAAGVGSPVVYVGSRTGRDGIHGATMASEEFGSESESKRPRVQVGDPFTEKKLMEACLELMDEDTIVAIQDMGAAGLTSSSCEMASKGDVGIEIDTARVPRREVGMTPYEVMLSESQERMLMVVRPGTEHVVKRIFDKWDLASAVVGSVTSSRRVVIKDGDDVVADLPTSLLVDAAPSYDRPYARPAQHVERWTSPPVRIDDPADTLVTLLARPTITSKRWAYEQYDSTVRASTVAGPGSADAAVVRLTDHRLRPTSNTRKGVAITLDMNGRWVSLDPRRGAALGVIEAARNLACVGAVPLAVTDCLNFGNPEKPSVMWTLVEAIEGLAEACKAMKTPVVSGNVSLYNETEGRPILPTPTIGMVGKVDDVGRVPGIAFQNEDDAIILLGDPRRASWAGSEIQLMRHGELTGRPVEPDYHGVRTLLETTLGLVSRLPVQSAHDAAEGGLATALAECCVSDPNRTRGARITTHLAEEDAHRVWFGEGADLVVMSVRSNDLEEALEFATRAGCPAQALGWVGGDHLIIEGDFEVPVAALARAFHEGLEEALNR